MSIYIYIYIYIYIKNKSFIFKQVIFLFLPNLESSKLWKKPKYNSLRNKCLIFDTCVHVLHIHIHVVKNINTLNGTILRKLKIGKFKKALKLN